VNTKPPLSRLVIQRCGTEDLDSGSLLNVVLMSSLSNPKEKTVDLQNIRKEIADEIRSYSVCSRLLVGSLRELRQKQSHGGN
jgi:hypothetical protein